jgi:hypothetical protein
VPNVREKPSMFKQRLQRFFMERFNLKKLNEVEGRKMYHIKASKRCTALEDLDTEVETNSAWETIGENNISVKESLE